MLQTINLLAGGVGRLGHSPDGVRFGLVKRRGRHVGEESRVRVAVVGGRVGSVVQEVNGLRLRGVGALVGADPDPD
jgi:hypothetical protein